MTLHGLPDRESLFAALPKGGVGAEIGVLIGAWANEILKLAEPRLLYAIDCWEHQPDEVTGHDPANVAQREKDDQYYGVLARWIIDPRVRVVKGFSERVAPLFPDTYFDWVYIDANHLQCHADMVEWWPKVKAGGWLLGHDYVVGGLGDFITVQADVDRFVAERGLTLELTADPVYQNWIIRKP
jgi:hypothetical protein